MHDPSPRKPLDERPLSEQYQFTQADSILSREKTMEERRRVRRKRRQWLASWLIVLAFFALVIWLL